MLRPWMKWVRPRPVGPHRSEMPRSCSTSSSARPPAQISASALVTGSFSGSVPFGIGEPAQTQLDSFGETDVFVARYARDGTLVWARSLGGGLADEGRGVAAVHDGGAAVANLEAREGRGRTDGSGRSPGL